jgi:type II secretory pathway pseudopilin PulG
LVPGASPPFRAGTEYSSRFFPKNVTLEEVSIDLCSAVTENAYNQTQSSWTRSGNMKRPEPNQLGRTQEAYSLPEVIVAVLVLAILVVALFGAFSSGLGLVQLQRENLRATQIMLQKMETVRLFTWSQMSVTNKFTPVFTDYYDPSATNGHSLGSTYVGYVSTDPTDWTTDYSANVRSVTVTIFWTNYPHGGKGPPLVRTRQMQTLVARYGLQNYIAQ